MESNNKKALVMQVSGDTVLLLCHGGKFMRTKLIEGMNVGEEIDTYGLEEITTLSVEAKSRPFKRFIIQVACVMLLVSGVFAFIVLTIRNVSEDKSNIDGDNTDSIAAYLKNMEWIGSERNDEESKDRLEEVNDSVHNNFNDAEDTKDVDHDENVDNDDIGNKESNGIVDEENEENNNEDNNDDTSTKDTEDKTAVGGNILDPEYSLAKELFGYEVSRNEFYSLGPSGHIGNSNEIVVADDIYIPFWGINMQAQEWKVPNTIDLSFTYSSIDEVPNFDKATVYLYDLTEQKELKSEVKGKMEGNYEDIDGVKLTEAYSTLNVDSSNMVDNHTYYIKINNVTKDSVKIDNIYYVFEYVPGGSIGFRYEN